MEDNSNTPTVRELIKKALTNAENDNWHEVWRLCRSELRYWLDREFAKDDVRLTEEDFADLDLIESMLGEVYGENAERIDKKCSIHPTFVKQELCWVRDTARELLVE